MKRNKEELAPEKLYFYKAKALKAGFLRMPDSAPSYLKAKGVLKKTGDYLVSKPRSHLTVLISTLIRNKAHIENYRITYKQKYFIWTFPKKEDVEAMDTYFRSVATGMCRHSRDELRMEKEGRVPKRADKRYYVKGVCSRTECQMLTTEDLLVTCLNMPCPDHERHGRFQHLRERFEVKEYALVDADDPRLHNDRGTMIVRGIQYKTVRYVGHSNGFESYIFQLCFHSESSLETVKNFIRPMVLRSKRASTKREFIIRQFAHDDFDTLQEWQKLIADCLVPVDHNSNLINAFKDVEDNLKRAPESDNFHLGKGLRNIIFDITNERIQDLVISGKPHADPGQDTETATGHLFTSLEIKDLFKYLVPICNDYKNDIYKKRFDKYIFGAPGEDQGYENYANLQVFIDPPMETNTFTAHYGYEKQALLVRAVKEDNIEFNNWLEENLPIKPSSGGGAWNFVFKKAVDFLANLTLGETNEKIDFSRDGKLIKRKFTMKKCFYSKSTPMERMSSFVVVWHCVGDEKNLSGDSEYKLEKASFNATLAEVLLKVEEVPSKEGPKVMGLTEADYENSLRYMPGEARKMICELAKDTATLSNIPQLVNPIFPPDSKSNAIEERMFDYLSRNSREQLRMAIFRYINVVFNKVANSGLGNTKLRAVYMALIDLTYVTVKDSKRLVVIKNGFMVFEKLLTYGVERGDVDDFQAKCDWHNIANFKFLDVLEYIMACNMTDVFGFQVMRLGIDVFKRLIEHQTSHLSRVTLNLIPKFSEILERMHREFSFEETPNRLDEDAILYFEKEFLKLNESFLTVIKSLFGGDHVAALQERKEVLRTLETLLPRDTRQHPAEKLRDASKLQVPVFNPETETGDRWTFTQLDPSTGTFNVNGRSLSLAQLKSLPTNAPSALSDRRLVNTFYQQSLGTDGKTDVKEQMKKWMGHQISLEGDVKEDIRDEYSNRQLDIDAILGKLMLFMEDTGHPLTDKGVKAILWELDLVKRSYLEVDDRKTKVSFSITGNARELFGAAFVDKFPRLQEQWCESIIKDISTGIRNVKKDAMYAKPLELMQRIDNCDQYVSNDDMKTFFRPRDSTEHDEVDLGVFLQQVYGGRRDYNLQDFIPSTQVAQVSPLT